MNEFGFDTSAIKTVDIEPDDFQEFFSPSFELKECRINFILHKARYKFDGVPDSALAGVKSAILAINASLAGGTDGGLKDFFRSDDFDDSDSSDIIGQFTGIVAAQIDSTQVTEINLNE